MKTIGYAIVGTGYFGAELGRIMKEQEGAKIVAVYDPENAETVAKELGCDVETDLDKLCSRDDVDAVLVDRKSTRLNSSHNNQSRMPSSA